MSGSDVVVTLFRVIRRSGLTADRKCMTGTIASGRLLVPLFVPLSVRLRLFVNCSEGASSKLFILPSFNQSVGLSVCLSVSVCLPICLFPFACLFGRLSVNLASNHARQTNAD